MAHLLRGGERVRPEPGPAVLLDRYRCAPYRPVRVDEMLGEPAGKVLDLTDAVFLGKGVHGVLLRVGRQHLVLSPVRWTSVKSPASAMLTDRSRKSWRSPLRATRASLISDLPYSFWPRITSMGSAPPIGGVRVRAHQQRHVVVLTGSVDHELDGYLWEERRETPAEKVVLDVEDQPVAAHRKVACELGLAGLRRVLGPRLLPG